MLKINWVDVYFEIPVLFHETDGEEDVVSAIKARLADVFPYRTILFENRGVYVLDLTDIKMYHSSKSLKPLWRIGDGFSKTLIATIEEVGEDVST